MNNRFKKILKKIFYNIVDFEPYLYRPECKIFKEKFEIHKTDKDIWPSYPHMHSTENDLVLNIYSGEVYRKITKKHIGDASEKDMEKLWNDEKFLSLVLEIRKNKPINLKNLEDIPIKWLENENLDIVK